MVAWSLAALASGLLLFWWLFVGRRRVGRGPRAGRRRLPVQEILDDPNLIKYEGKDVDLPSLSGRVFSYFTKFLFTRFGNTFLVPFLLDGLDLFLFSGEYIPEEPVTNFRLLVPPPEEEDFSQENQELIWKLLKEEEEEDGGEGGEGGEDGGGGEGGGGGGCEGGGGGGERRRNGKEESFHFPSVQDYYRAYKSSRCTPVDVANAVLDAVKKSNLMTPPLRAIVDYDNATVLKMAEESAHRWKEGKPISPLDGVPVSLKGEFNTKPYPCRCGTVFVPVFAERYQESDLVINLKEAGAVIIGVANMHELGSGALGSNPNRFHGTARNPYNTGYYAGGSSSGSGASIAAGLCPISIGADAGGSVRIPASLCSLFGIKPTHGLLVDEGKMIHSPSLSCPGPLSGTALDAIIAINILARNSRGSVNLPLRGVDNKTLNGLKVGVYDEFFDHCEDNVREVCRSSLQILEHLGAVVTVIKIPEVFEIGVALMATAMGELSCELAPDVDKHFDVLNSETLVFLAPGYQLPATDYINAQKQRTRTILFLKKIFGEVDVIVTPATACVAPRINRNALSHGKLLSGALVKLMRFCTLANLAGNPAISCPVGATKEGLPVGLQFIGKWYDEPTLLSIALQMERSREFQTHKPSVFFNILKTASSNSER